MLLLASNSSQHLSEGCGPALTILMLDTTAYQGLKRQEGMRRAQIKLPRLLSALVRSARF